LLLNGEWRMTSLGHLVWNIIPTLAILLTLSAWLVIRKRYFWLILTGMLLIHAIALFFTAPANFFMYYFPVYLCGNFLIILIVITHREKQATNEK